jgi:ABC-type glycerol-3-phosphate transport system substrate-binding protein
MAHSYAPDVAHVPAEVCQKAGCAFGIGLATTADSVDTAGVIFQSFGAALVDGNEKITVMTDAVREVLDYYKRRAQFFPAVAPAWDDACNNKWLISGKSALIVNSPRAWAVAKRDAPLIAEQCWTHGMPAGPKGRFAPYFRFFWGIWELSRSQPAAIEKLVEASGG